jgi:tetratricopeptide (TPR) repeat protein
MKPNLKPQLILLLILATCLSSSGQDANESVPYKQEKAVYLLASKYADVNIARNAIYNLMAMDPNDESLLDSLAYMYYDYQKYTSCLLVCLDIIKRNPDHMPALEMSGVAYESLGLKDKALTSYESIYLRNSSVLTLYKMAILQLDLNRLGESMTNVGILLEKEETKEAKVSINTQQGPSQISLTAAVYNLKGLIESSQENKEEARTSFQEALALEPDFTVAKNNLEELDK